MTVRAKFQLQEIRQHAGAGAKALVLKTLVFRPQYDNTIPEDRRFAKASPSGEFTIWVDNPAALEQFELGAHYYIDFNPV